MTDVTTQAGQAPTDAAPANGAPEAGQGQQAPAEGGQQQQQQPGAESASAQQPNGENKPEGQQADKGEGKPQGQEGAPEQYEDFTMPEGVAIDTETSGELKVLAKELGLPQASAQKIADLGVKLQQRWSTQQAEQLKAAAVQWEADARADKELGGDKFDANLGVAKKALDAFASSEFKTLLKESGLGNHPEVIRMFHRVGKAISEDKVLTGKAPDGAPRDPAKTLYPNQN